MLQSVTLQLSAHVCNATPSRIGFEVLQPLTVEQAARVVTRLWPFFFFSLACLSVTRNAHPYYYKIYLLFT